MKRILVLTLSIFWFSFIYSQDVFDGIFGISLGMSQKEITQLVGANHIKDDLSEEIQKQLKTTDVKRFRVDEYFPKNDSFAIKNILLVFYKDKLCNIIIKDFNTTLENLFTEKYGESEIKDNQKIWETNDFGIRCFASWTVSKEGNKEYSFTLYDLMAMLNSVKNVQNKE